MHFVFMEVTLMRSGQQHVAAGHVATCTSLQTEDTCGEMWPRFVSGDTLCTAIQSVQRYSVYSDTVCTANW